ncbi:MAG: hypothetical protein H6559_34695 [Lewinellaceae bacterium]|nr:hypothetical protein [Lewinellaceae bacterium]
MPTSTGTVPQDLIVGERTGNINYFQNIGTASSPMFNPSTDVAPNIFALGNINTVPSRVISPATARRWCSTSREPTYWSPARRSAG